MKTAIKIVPIQRHQNNNASNCHNKKSDDISPEKSLKKLLKNRFQNPRSTNFFTPQLHNWPYLLRRWLLKKDLSLCFTSTSRFLLFLNFLSILHDFFVFIRSRLINKLMLAICVTQCCREFFSYFLLVLGFRKMNFPYRFPRFSVQWIPT